MKVHKIFKCPSCIKNRKSCKLVIKKKFFICNNCKSFYPCYKKFPVLLTLEEDFYHLKKALMPAKYRVFKYGN
jgi:uncharacterized protein YbaR (Trm112 family)